MKKRFLAAVGISIALITSVLIIAGCGTQPNPQPPTDLPTPPSTQGIAATRPLVTAVNNFGFSLLQDIKRTSNENTVISPVSIHEALSMTVNGANGTTKNQMRKTLGIDSLSEDAANAQWKTLNDIFKTAGASDPKTARTLDIANSIWYQKGHSMKTTFAATIKDSFGAQASPADFAKPQAAKSINDWVSKQTSGNIQNLIERTDASDRLYLVNAVYFHADWEEPFEKESTQDATFTKADSHTVKVPMMHNETFLPVYQTKSYQATKLAYQDGKTSFYIFLPNKVNTTDTVLTALANGGYQTAVAALSSAESTNVALTLPKLDTKLNTNLAPQLEHLGMPDAFDDKANFSRMLTGGDDLYIAKVIHATRLKVDEEGTTAAAATAVGIMSKAAPVQQQPLEFTCDHPYICALVDDTSGATLFLGVINDPQN